MRKSYRNALLVAVALVFFIVVAGAAGGLWFFATHFDFTSTDAAAAEQRFDEVRQRFAAAGPVMGFDGREMRLTRPVPAASSSGRLETVRVLVWNPSDRNLVRVALPAWLLRLSHDPIRVSVDGGETTLVETPLTFDTIERYGPALVLDYEDDGGERILVWTE